MRKVSLLAGAVGAPTLPAATASLGRASAAESGVTAIVGATAEAAFYLGFDDPACFTRAVTKGCGAPHVDSARRRAATPP